MDCPIVTPRWSVASDDPNKNHVLEVFDALIMADSVGVAEVQCSASAKTRAVYGLPMLAHAILESQNCTAVPDGASIDLHVWAGSARTTRLAPTTGRDRNRVLAAMNDDWTLAAWRVRPACG